MQSDKSCFQNVFINSVQKIQDGDLKLDFLPTVAHRADQRSLGRLLLQLEVLASSISSFQDNLIKTIR